jgi:hypothetical protein
MTPEQNKLNKEYFKLLEKYGKMNKDLVIIKKRMAEIRTKIVPCQPTEEDRPDLITMKESL